MKTGTEATPTARRGRAPRRGPLAALPLALAALALLAALVAAPASAEQVRPFLEQFGSAEQPSFENPTALAVEQSTGDVYVADSGADTLSRFHSDGTPSNFSALGTNVIDGEGGADETPDPFTMEDARFSQIAIDESGAVTDGDIYVTHAEYEHAQLYVFAAGGEYLGSITKANFNKFLEAVCGVGVEQSSGDLFLAEGNYARVYHYVPSANPPLNSDAETAFLGFGTGHVPCNVALGAGPTEGSLFVSTQEGEYAGVTKWDIATGEYKYTIVPPDGEHGGEPTHVSAVLALDPESGHLFVGETGVHGEVTEYDASGASEATLVSTTRARLNGIAVDGSADRLYVSAGPIGEGKVNVYGSVVTVPTVATEAAGEVTTTEATLNGAVDPDGLEVTECLFEYGETEAYGSSAPCEEPDASEIGSGESPVAVHADLAGLEPNTTYHYRLVAANAEGPNQGEDESFKTKALPHPLTLEKTGGGAGWVTSTDSEHALNCGLPCSERSAEFNGVVTLHAYGREFAGWAACPGSVVEAGRGCSVNLSEEAKTVVAEFVPLKALTVVKTGGGAGWVTSLDAEHRLNCGLGCPTERTAYFEAGPVELRAYGSQFGGWTNCAGSVGGYQNRVCTMELTASSETAEVEFE